VSELHPAPSAAAELGARLRVALDMVDAGLDLMRCNLRRQHPAANDERIQELLNEWLLQRPRAELGDGDPRELRVRTRAP